MADPIYRQKTQGLERRTQRAAASPRGIDRTPAQTQVSDNSYGMQVLTSIVNAAGSVTKKVGMELQQRIETDKVNQMNLALRGAAPTDDATEAGYMAHGVVGLQNKTLAASTRLRSEAATFTGSDEDWDARVASEFQGIQTSMFADYPQIESNDAKQGFLGHITNAFNEQMPQLAMSREAGKLQQHHTKRVADFTDNLLLRSKDLKGDELNKSLTGLLSDGSKSLQLTGRETDDVLVNAALNAAAQGDDRLLTFTQNYMGEGKTSLMERDGRLQTMRSKFNSQAKLATEGAQAQTQADLMDRYNNGSLTFEQLAAESDSSVQSTGKSVFTAEKLIALRKAKQTSTVKKVDLDTQVDSFIESSYEGSDVLGVTITDSKTQQAIIVEAKARIDEQSAQILARLPDGGTEEQKQQLKLAGVKQLAERVSAAQFVNKEWKDSLDSLQNFNLENADMDGDMPANAQEIINLWRGMPEGSRLDHAGPKTSALMANMEMFERQGQNPIQALQSSQRSVRFTRLISKTEREDFESAATSVADEISDGSWMPFDSAPDWYADRFRQVMKDATMVNIKAGYTSPELAARDAGAAFEKYYTRTGKGQLLFGDVGTISKNMGVHSGDIDLTLDTYMEMHREELEDAANGGNIDEMYFDTIPNRGTVVIRNGITGVPLTSPIPLSDLKKGRDDFIATRKEEQERKSAEQLEKKQEGFDKYNYGFNPNGKVEQQVITQSENAPEERDAFNKAMMQVENSIQSGRSNEGAWSPHISLEGGTKTLAFGHKLTSAEVAQGYVEVNGKQYSFKEGESQITDNVAKLIMAQDLELADTSLKSKWEGYEELPIKYQRVLQNLEFNAGISKSNWPKLIKAMEDGDDAEVRAQMITKYTDIEGKDIGLYNRATSVADAAGLK